MGPLFQQYKQNLLSNVTYKEELGSTSCWLSQISLSTISLINTEINKHNYLQVLTKQFHSFHQFLVYFSFYNSTL